MCKRRDATPEETAEANALHEDGEARHAEAVNEGHKAEVCLTCDKTFPAFIHFIRCDSPDCGMVAQGAKSLLDVLAEGDNPTSQTGPDTD